jgi:adenosylcobinamide-GDP ribazoletransferase
MYRGKYARPGGGLGNFYIGKITTGRFITTLIIGSMILFGGLQIQGILMVGVCMLTIFLFRKWMEKTIDGMTGDILGAGIEIAEIMFLITLAI